MFKVKKITMPEEGVTLHDFMIFYAPVLMVFASIGTAFWIASKDEVIK
jgi:hypothetical protein